MPEVEIQTAIARSTKSTSPRSEYYNQYYQEHKDQRKAYYEAHKDQYKAYYEAHKEEIRAKNRARYHAKKQQRQQQLQPEQTACC